MAEASGWGCGVAEGSQACGAELVPRRRSCVCRRMPPRTFPYSQTPRASTWWPSCSWPSVPQWLSPSLEPWPSGPLPSARASPIEPRPHRGHDQHPASRLSVERAKLILRGDRHVLPPGWAWCPLRGAEAGALGSQGSTAFCNCLWCSPRTLGLVGCCTAASPEMAGFPGLWGPSLWDQAMPSSPGSAVTATF